MIYDHINHAWRYAEVHPGFKAAFDFLRSSTVSQLPPGKHEIDGERLYAMISRDPGRGRDAAKLEAHHEYIDIQYVCNGSDLFGWKPLESCRQVDTPFDAERDFGLFADPPDIWIPLPGGMFVIFFPEDAHAPLADVQPMVKAVVKVAVDFQ
jgi:YhcH/YjgK/YiaL family protein